MGHTILNKASQFQQNYICSRSNTMIFINSQKSNFKIAAILPVLSLWVFACHLVFQMGRSLPTWSGTPGIFGHFWTLSTKNPEFLFKRVPLGAISQKNSFSKIPALDLSPLLLESIDRLRFYTSSQTWVWDAIPNTNYSI